jgi:hypothetical protein
MLLGAIGQANTFRDMFQEFRLVPDVTTQGYLDMAAHRLSLTELGLGYDEAHANLAAHLIATSPAGVSSRMVNKDGTTTYSARLLEIRSGFCHAFGVL